MSRRILSVILSLLLIVTVAVFPVSTPAAAGEPSVVTFSHEGGLYNANFSLSLSADSGSTIRYTTDGTEPTASSAVYNGPITIKPRTDYPLTSALGNAISPVRNVYSFMVVKAKAFNEAGESKTITNTYIVDPDVESIFGGIRIFSLSINTADFCGPNGFYQQYQNEKLEPQCFMEYYNADGTLGFKHSASVKISGHASRAQRKKSFRFNFTKGKYEDDGEKLQFDLFPQNNANYEDPTKVTEFAKMNLRITDWTLTNMRDTLAMYVGDVLRNDTAATEASCVFVNGEFWGVYDSREQYDNNYIATHYDGIKKKEVVKLDFDHDGANPEYSRTEPLYRVDYSEGPDGEEQKWYDYYMKMYNLINGTTNGKTIADPEVYAQACETFDVDNFIDYWLFNMFFDFYDWPGNNIKMWCTTTTKDGVYGADGKWRWMIHDYDISCDSNRNYNLPNSSTPGYEEDQMVRITTSSGDTNSRWPTWAMKTYKNLLTNEEFRNRLAARHSTYYATAFDTARCQALVDMLTDRVRDYKGLDIYRWNINGGNRNNLNSWLNEVTKLRNYFNTRAINTVRDIRNYYNNNFNLGANTEYTTFNFQTDARMGYFDIAGARVRASDYGLEKASSFSAPYIRKLPVEITATPLDGYEFVRFEVTYAGSKQNYANSTITLTPPNNTSEEYSVKAIFASTGAVDKTDLHSAIERAQNVNASLYTTSTMAAVTTALNNAIAVNANADATQADVNGAVDAINSAIGNLEEAANKAVLLAALNEAAEYDLELYTTETVAAVTAAVTTGNQLLTDGDATQEAVNAAAAAITAALAALELLPAPAVIMATYDFITSASKFEDSTLFNNDLSDASSSGYAPEWKADGAYNGGSLWFTSSGTNNNTGACLSVPVNAVPTGDSFTFSLWVYYPSANAANWRRVLDFGESSQYFCRMVLANGSGRPEFTICNNGTRQQVIASSSTFPKDEWTHYAVTLTDSNVATMYINGVQVAQNANFSYDLSMIPLTNRYLGGKSQYATDTTFTGGLDEVKISNYAWTAEQIAAEYALLATSQPADKEDLAAAIAAAKAYTLSQYTTETATALSQAISAGEALMAKEDATQDEVDTATAALHTAITGLEFAIDKTELMEAIDDASAANLTLYTPSTAQAVQDAYDAGVLVHQNNDATQEQVDAATAAILNAMEALVEKADKTALQAAIALGAGYKLGLYTETTAQAVSDALDAAIIIVADDEALQTTVDNATTAITTAIEGLVLAPVAPTWSASADKTSYATDELITVTVVTSATVEKVYLVSESGNGLVSTRTAVTDSDGQTTWTLTLSLGTIGSRTLKVYADGVDTETSVSFDIVYPQPTGAPVIYGVLPPLNVRVNEAFTVTFITNTSTEYVRLFNEYGAGMTPSACSYTDENGRRTWSYTIAVGTAGQREFTAKAAAADRVFAGDILVSLHVGK